ncbi:hypothetical protein Lal_00041096 [Lupinus albus]|nr:hypothetical protein Lal_00041096 [Lupinus albus]
MGTLMAEILLFFVYLELVQLKYFAINLTSRATILRLRSLVAFPILSKISILTTLVRERLQAQLFHLLPIPTKEQPADLFTKALDYSSFSYLLPKLGVLNLYSPT